MKKTSNSKLLARVLYPLLVMVLMVGASGSPSATAFKPQNPPNTNFVVTDTWAVAVQPNTDPDQLAAQVGAENLGPIGDLPNMYLFRIAGSDKEVTAAADVFALSDQIQWYQQQVGRQQSKRSLSSAFSAPIDPLYSSQWYLTAANVPAAWALGPTDTGYTGAGVTVAVVDDGFDYLHDDLDGQFLLGSSYDFNFGDANPFPDVLTDYHGTAVAGIIGANRNDNKCGVGVAYDANLANLRLTSGASTDAMEAAALNYAYGTTAIYNNSWGPEDDGARLEGPGILTTLALQRGAAIGRSGRGNIYVWAAGNGRKDIPDDVAGPTANLLLDNVNYDGYANSRYTIAVGAVDNLGKQAYYSEPGAAMVITAPSGSDGAGPNGMVTTDLVTGLDGYNKITRDINNNIIPDGDVADEDCTSKFSDPTTPAPDGFREHDGGTSASAAVVSGVVALMLQANPNLGWRDVQNILIRTATKNDPTDPDWYTNHATGGGLPVNHKYGFGLVNAAAAVTMAKTGYVNLPSSPNIFSGVIPVNQSIPDNNFTGITSTFNVTQDVSLEHVEVVFNATHTYRGDLKVVLTSPTGTQSVLSESHNDSDDNYVSWNFMTVRDWGESSLGTWTLKVTDEKGSGIGTFDSWQLNFYKESAGSVFGPTSRWTTDFDYGHGWRVDQHVRTVGDVNGDGKDDAVGFGLDGIYVSISNGTGFNPISRWTTDFDYGHGWRVDQHVRTVGDVNGDGKDDAVGFGLDGVYVALSNGSGFNGVTRWTTDFDYGHGWRVDQHVRTVGDVNGDGKDDLIGFGLDGVYVALSNGSGFNGVTRWTTSFDYGHGWRVDQHVRTVGDVNGDGKADLVGYGLDGVYVALSNGSSFDAISRWTTDFNYAVQGWRVDQHPRTVGDVNGDGKDDLLGFGLDGVYVATSSGTKFNGTKQWTTDFNYGTQGWRVNLHPRTAGDMDGDGKFDVVGFGLDGIYVATAR